MRAWPTDLFSPVLVFLVTFTWSNSSLALSRMNFTCPDKFVATVEAVEDELFSASAMAKNTISFKEVRRISGEKKSSPKLSLTKYSGVTIEEGKSYIVEMRNGFLCSIKELDNSGQGESL